VNRLANVLLVEDSPSDVRLVREAILEGEFAMSLHVARDGEAATRFLLRQGEFADKPRPDIVLLDLNLPRRDGREVLREIKTSPVLRSIPVIVLSTSTDSDDVRSCYELHANCYIAKPCNLDAFIAAMRRIREFWLDLVTLPAE
jgi:CheY-like chemotaxis protein